MTTRLPSDDDDFDLNELSMWRSKKARRAILTGMLVVLGMALSMGAYWWSLAPFQESCSGPLDCRSAVCLTFGPDSSNRFAPSHGSCSLECAQDSDCPSSFRCEVVDTIQACVPEPSVEIGGTCISNFECLDQGECLYKAKNSGSSFIQSYESMGTCEEQGTLEAHQKARREHQEAQQEIDDALRQLRSLSGQPYNNF